MPARTSYHVIFPSRRPAIQALCVFAAQLRHSCPFIKPSCHGRRFGYRWNREISRRERSLWLPPSFPMLIKNRVVSFAVMLYLVTVDPLWCAHIQGSAYRGQFCIVFYIPVVLFSLFFSDSGKFFLRRDNTNFVHKHRSYSRVLSRSKGYTSCNTYMSHRL